MRGACAYTEGVPSVFGYAAALLALRDMDLAGREGQLLADFCLPQPAETDQYGAVVVDRYSSSEQLRDLCPINSLPQPVLSSCEAESR